MKAEAPSSMDMEDITSLQEENARLREELHKLESQNQELKDHEINLQNTLSELRESEQRFRLLVSGVKDYAIFMLTPEGNIASWNEGAQRIKGYSADEIIGRHFSTFYTEEDILDGKPPRELR